DRRLLLRDWNAPACTYPDVTVHELFRARVTQQPDAEALRAAGRTVSYAALDRASDERAARLTPLVRTPGALVVLSGRRDVGLFTWILAVLKAGAGYVFLDPGLPEARARTLVELTDPVAVLATDSGHPVARALMVRPEAVDRVAAVEARPDTTAYVL